MENLRIVIASQKKGPAKVLSKTLRDIEGEFSFLTFPELRANLGKEAPGCLLLLSTEENKVTEELIDEVKVIDDHLPIIVFSESEKVEDVVRLMKKGIYDYFIIPPDASHVTLAVQNACRVYHLTKRVFLLEKQLGLETKFCGIIGASPVMQTIYQTIKNVSQTNATVLISGPSGTGKELVAKAIHQNSKRVNRQFIDINCGAIPRELLENELFGHERGAYTGADRRYIGCCERANGGTLFLDEIGEMDVSLQVKLLRFLQERTFMRVGGTSPIRVDLAIVAATNANLAQAVKEGRFRQDLFYRLNVVGIEVPPLRERREDIPLLAKHFLEKYSDKNEKVFLNFEQNCMDALLQYDWPGNIRELENTIERAVVLYNDTKIKLEHLAENFRNPQGNKGTPMKNFTMNQMGSEKIMPLVMIERFAIEQALQICSGNVATAAKKLQIGQATLYRKIKQYGIQQ